MKKIIKKITPKKYHLFLNKLKYFVFHYSWTDELFFLIFKQNYNEKVSIIIPSYNNVRYLREAVLSALNQTYKNIEIIVMTDVPELGAKKELFDLLDKITLLEEPNLHMTEKFNELVKKTTGELVIFLSDDDILTNKFVEKTVFFLNRKKVDIVYVDTKPFGIYNNYAYSKEYKMENFTECCNMPLTSLFKKDVWRKAEGYHNKGFFDWDFWWTALENNFSAYHLKQPLFLYRTHPNQDTYFCDFPKLTKEVQDKHKKINKMKILLVGPGAMEIPSKGWGAVETVIWQLKIHLEQLGHHVDILNKNGLKNALSAKPASYDVVHLEYDNLAGLWIILSKFLGFKLIITSHYGYSAWPKKWHRSYWPVFLKLLFSPALIVLSPEIKDNFLRFHYKGFIEVLPNGTEIDDIKFSLQSEKDLICLGKIEPRKRQTELSKIFSSQNEISVDFIGPIVDKRFFTNKTSTKYLNTWTREEVKENMTKYKALILLSDGEAHALVIGEALAAGLSLIISKEAAANLDLNKPFIKIVKDEKEALAIAKKVCKENKIYRKEIRDYAKENFDWSYTAKQYIEIVNKLLNQQ